MGFPVSHFVLLFYFNRRRANPEIFRSLYPACFLGAAIARKERILIPSKIQNRLERCLKAQRINFFGFKTPLKNCRRIHSEVSKLRVGDQITGQLSSSSFCLPNNPNLSLYSFHYVGNTVGSPGGGGGLSLAPCGKTRVWAKNRMSQTFDTAIMHCISYNS